MRYISKKFFLNTLACPSLGWLLRHDQIDQSPTIGDRFVMEQGMEVERRARDLYPDGVLIEWDSWNASVEKTKEIITDEDIPVVFAAFFQVDNYRTKSDILIRKDNAWHMMEVKSGTSAKPEYIEDMAYTTMVLKRSGLDISSVSLLAVSKEFRLGMDNKALFNEYNLTDEVFEIVTKFEPLWETVDKITSQGSKPTPELRFECKKCIIFNECLGRDVENHIFDIPRLSQSKFSKLIAAGITNIEAIPATFSLTDNQKIVKISVQENKPRIGAGLRKSLENIKWPAFYLDFESINPAIPLFPDVAPFTQIPTQFSIHRCSEAGKIVSHTPYLSDPSKDCRRELTEKMIKVLEGEGSIIVYSHFEKGVITRMISEFTDLNDKLLQIIGRLVNLERIIGQNVYFQGFHGKTSIKKVAPVLVPGISYGESEISDGKSAMAVFLNLRHAKYDETESQVMRESLLKYCELDTYSLVKLHEKLYELI